MHQVSVSRSRQLSTNLGPGNYLGMVLDLRHDVTFSLQPAAGLRITAVVWRNIIRSPLSADNLVFQAAEIIFQHLGTRAFARPAHPPTEQHPHRQRLEAVSPF